MTRVRVKYKGQLYRHRHRALQPADGYVTIMVNGQPCKIAPDRHQPGAEARFGPWVGTVGSVIRSAQEMRAKDAAIR